MQSSSVFDPNTFLETTHKGNLDTTFVLPDEDEYLCQLTEKITLRSGEGDDGRKWAAVTFQCELIDAADQCRKLNMERIFVSYDMFLDLTDDGRLDLGTNRNMRLKRLWEATGVNKQKQVTIGMLKFQTFWGRLEHQVDRNDSEQVYAKITRAASPDKARVREAAQ